VKYAKMMETTPEYIIYDEYMMQEQKQHKWTSFKIDAIQTRLRQVKFDLEPKVNDVQMS